jgi:large subunit ribosomal protein L22
METATAQLNNLRISPRKVRLVANFMRGKKATDALDNLSFVDKRSAAPLKKLLASALANAKSLDLKAEDLYVREITVNGGETLYRRMPAPRGRAMMIRKKTSKIKVVLGGKSGKKLAAIASKNEAVPAEAEKAPAKAPRKPRAKKSEK